MKEHFTFPTSGRRRSYGFSRRGARSARCRLGKLNEARVAAARLIEAVPDSTVAGFERTAQSILSRPELVAAISSALTEAGLP